MAAENIVILSGDNFETEVVKSNIPVVVDFWAEWCGPCKMLAPVLDELAGKYDGKVKISKVNVDNNQDLATKYGISTIPQLICFKDGEVVNQISGLKSIADLSASFDELLA
ncbi:MAG: thioredoxin [Verrucomicrobiia bacterium]|jgi:thioredoxin 1